MCPIIEAIRGDESAGKRGGAFVVTGRREGIALPAGSAGERSSCLVACTNRPVFGAVFGKEVALVEARDDLVERERRAPGGARRRGVGPLQGQRPPAFGFFMAVPFSIRERIWYELRA